MNTPLLGRYGLVVNCCTGSLFPPSNDKGQIIFSQGDPANAVFYIQTGKVKITVVSEQASESKPTLSTSYSIRARNASRASFAKISQETLAEMIGATRSRVSFFMNKFRKLGLIDYKSSGVEVHSSLLSLVPHEHPRNQRESFHLLRIEP